MIYNYTYHTAVFPSGYTSYPTGYAGSQGQWPQALRNVHPEIAGICSEVHPN